MHTQIQQNGHRRTRSHQEELIKRPSQNRGDWRRNANRKEKVCSLLRLWIWIQIIAVFFYLSLSRIVEADNPGHVLATAKLFAEQLEAIGQWATNLASKSEM